MHVPEVNSTLVPTAVGSRASRLNAVARVVVGQGWKLPIDAACFAARQLSHKALQRQRAEKPLSDFVHDQHSPLDSSSGYLSCILDTLSIDRKHDLKQ